MLTDMTCLPVLTVPWKTFFKAASPGNQDMGKEEEGETWDLETWGLETLTLLSFTSLSCSFCLHPPTTKVQTARPQMGRQEEKAVLWVSEAVRRAPTNTRPSLTVQLATVV